MSKRKINEEDNRASKYQEERITAFDDIEKQILNVVKSLRKAKIETIKYYRDNPDKFAVVYGTDLIKDYINDINILLSQTQENE